jgi:hypothetical protein
MLRGGWFLPYWRQHQSFSMHRIPAGKCIDVIVAVVDHFEPSGASGTAAAARAVASWCEAYGRIAGRHRDSDGRKPQHTWFYRAEYPNPGCLEVLSEAAFRGLGEVEFHLHHGHDSHDSFGQKLASGLDFFNSFGAMLTAEPEPRRRFAYIAGNWALDNGAGDDALSGCNTELIALRQAGCYADFTFPALGTRAQPRKSNAIYYATDDPGPKSYDSGIDVEVGRAASGDLMLLQGPSVVDWRRGRFEDGALESFAPLAPERMAAWLDAHVHVRGRPEWIFVKLHTHGLQSQDVFLSDSLDRLFEAMSLEWNRPPFRLHFVTAREAYNLVKAAEAGLDGNPNEYRDFDVKPPANRLIHVNAPWQLTRADSEAVHLDLLEGRRARLEPALAGITSIEGELKRVEISMSNRHLASLRLKARGELRIDVEDDVELTMTGPAEPGNWSWRKYAAAAKADSLIS